MIVFPNAKINLGLFITSRREDGYHNLETVFYPIPAKDVLEIIPASETKLHLSGKAVEGNLDTNLVWKAYQLLKERFPNEIEPLDIYLHKAIPMGAGLGGGSADGAFMLRLLNGFFNLELVDEELIELALQLGSDCPFFIRNTPQLATGRGEVMQPIDIDLSGFSLQLICPQVHVSTAKAFSMLSPHPAPFDLSKLADYPVKDWKDFVRNDFEASVFEMHPVLDSIKQQLYHHGALYAAMSGSGSAVYGIFPKRQRAVVHIDTPYEEFYFE